MLVVLAFLCVLFSLLTIKDQSPEGAAAGKILAKQILRDRADNPKVLIVARQTIKDTAFTTELRNGLEAGGAIVIDTIQGQPSDARRALEKLNAKNTALDVIACNEATVSYGFFTDLGASFPSLTNAAVVTPNSRPWPAFLRTDNLLNIAGQLSVIAIAAIGMTMVILTAGIDLSVGSIIALSAVVTTWCIREFAGAQTAGVAGVVACCAIAVLVCAALGAFSGTMVTAFGVPPFITTLAMMLMARGVASIISNNQSIYEVPDSFDWLGTGASFLGIPNAVILMVLLYLGAQIVMTKTLLGRYIYAVGGNPEAAFLSGVPVKKVLLITYTVCGGLAGLGGVVLASQLKSGSPTYGVMYELYVIAAVVVGGTSLFGGRGKIFGTLIGVFIIAVIQNGMNLTHVKSEVQGVVLGAIILGAILLDQLKAKFIARAALAS